MTTITSRTPIQSAPLDPTIARQYTQMQQLARDVASVSGLAAKGAAYHRIADGVTDHAQATRLFETFYNGLAKPDQAAVGRYFAGVTAAAHPTPSVPSIKGLVPPPLPPASAGITPLMAGLVPPPPLPSVAQPADPFGAYVAAHPQVGSFLGQVSGQYGSQAGDALALLGPTVAANKQQYGSQYDLFLAAQLAAATGRPITF